MATGNLKIINAFRLRAVFRYDAADLAKRAVNMSNGNAQNGSIWPLMVVLVGIVAIGAVAWDVMLQNRNQSLEHRLQKLETRLNEMDLKEKNAEAAAAAARRRARAAAAAQEKGAAEEKDNKDKDKGKDNGK